MGKNFVSLKAEQWELLREIEKAKRFIPDIDDFKALNKLCQPRIWQEQTLVLLEWNDDVGYRLTDEGLYHLNLKKLSDTQRSQAEATFEGYWQEYGDARFVMTTQAKVIEGKKSAFDFAFLEQRVLVDIQGGGRNGAHLRFTGYERDVEKMFLAEELGYRVIWLTSTMISTEDKARRWIEGLVTILEQC